MTYSFGVHRDQAKDSSECRHCSSDWIYVPTNDALEEVAFECHMCLGTGRKMSRAQRIAFRPDPDVHYSGLERTEG